MANTIVNASLKVIICTSRDAVAPPLRFKAVLVDVMGSRWRKLGCTEGKLKVDTAYMGGGRVIEGPTGLMDHV